MFFSAILIAFIIRLPYCWHSLETALEARKLQANGHLYVKHCFMIAAKTLRMALLCQECQQGLSSLSSQFDDLFAEPVFQCFRKKFIRYF
jgi:hypothetical protein